jgi:hypothetical protein
MEPAVRTNLRRVLIVDVAVKAKPADNAPRHTILANTGELPGSPDSTNRSPPNSHRPVAELPYVPVSFGLLGTGVDGCSGPTASAVTAWTVWTRPTIQPAMSAIRARNSGTGWTQLWTKPQVNAPEPTRRTHRQRPLNPQVSGSTPEGRTTKEQVTSGKSKYEARRSMLNPTPIHLTDTP